MAVPTTVTVKDLTGKYSMNKTISDSSATTLKIQSVGFIVRQTVQYSPITIELKQYTDDAGTIHLDQVQTVVGGITSDEERTIDGVLREKDNPIWGKVKGTTK